MTDEEALLAAIIAHPDEDTPRLMYADWLEEHGQPDRAEFIRVQCRLAHPGPGEARDWQRVGELEQRHHRTWLAGLPAGPDIHWYFRRGFPELLEASTSVLVERYDRFAAVPWLRSLHLNEFGGTDSREFVNHRWGPQWVELELWGVSSPHDPDSADMRAVVAVANCPQTRQLRELRLGFFDLTAAAVEALATSPHFDGLHVLGIPGELDRPLFAPLHERFGGRLVGEGG